MPKLKKPQLPEGPHGDLNDALHDLHLRAGLPSLRDLVDGVGDRVAGKSRIHDAFSSDRLPAWGLLQLLVEAMVKTVPGSDLRAEESRLYQLWLAASGHSAATDTEGVVVQQPESLSASPLLHAQQDSDIRLVSTPRKGPTFRSLTPLKYAALSYTVGCIEPDWADCIRQRGFYLSTGLERDSLAVSPQASLPHPSAASVTCQVSEKARRLDAAQHLGNLRGDLLTLGLDFADEFKDAVDKIINGESVNIVDHQR
ncbi:hypothetical protein [Streptomyces platensis]|uniref:hypothetical protein n=1 Tax=Streptomyces platensis TaxID=58346 RepID=UPI00331BBEF1